MKNKIIIIFLVIFNLITFNSFSEDQINVTSKIKTALDSKEFSPFLLHGVTGSGKTEIYIDSVLKLGKENAESVAEPVLLKTKEIIGFLS